jgi:hypothetical protein
VAELKEPVLKRHLAEAVEALQNQLAGLIDDGFHPEQSVNDTRAALAFFEQLAAVEVTVVQQDGVVEPRIFAEARTPEAYGASLLHVWHPEDHDQAEVEAVAHLAALLQCQEATGA